MEQIRPTQRYDRPRRSTTGIWVVIALLLVLLALLLFASDFFNAGENGRNDIESTDGIRQGIESLAE